MSRRPLLARLSLAVVAAAALPALSITSSAAAVAAPASAECEVAVEGGLEVRAKPDARTPEPDPSRGEPDLLQGVEPTSVSAAGSIVVPTVVHVISATGSRKGAVTDKQIADQMAVLNAAFSGEQGGDGVDTPFRFRLDAVTRTVNPAWADLVYGTPAEQQAKTALRRGGKETLNVYVGGLGGGLLGYAYFPMQGGKSKPWQDGVVVLDQSLPGGDAAPYNLGDTLPHEVGHWLGLHHTFNGGCSESNDRISDTPAQAYPNFVACSESEGVDTCARQPGLDPVENFMDYSDDACMNAFSRGQAARMDAVWQRYRAV